MALKKLIGLAVAFMLTLTVSFADNVALNPDHPDRYVVREGDTLWDISEQFLRDPWLWPEVWHVNPQIENPHLIYPGDVISLRYDRFGRPMLTLQRGRPTLKLSPQVRESPLRRAIPTIPIKVIYPFLTRPLVVTDEELNAAPYVVNAAGEHLVAAPGHKVYVRGLQDDGQERYTVFRRGQTYRNPGADKDDILGYEAIFVGDAGLNAVGDPSTLTVLDVNREVRVGDRLLPTLDKEFDANFMPRAPEQAVEGLILAVHDGVNQIGRYHVVAINLGAQDGMEPGHVLEIWQTGATIKDPISGKRGDEVTLPDENAGVLMVFRTFQRVSYALVMRAYTNIRVYDKLRTPRS